MSNDKSVLSRFGLKVIDFNFNNLELDEDKGEKLPDELKDEVVQLRRISGEQFEEFAVKHANAEKDQEKNPGRIREVRAELVAMCLFEDGEIVFKDAKECNEKLNNTFLTYCFAACQQINAISRKAKEEAEKNS